MQNSRDWLSPREGKNTPRKGHAGVFNGIRYDYFELSSDVKQHYFIIIL